MTTLIPGDQLKLDDNEQYLFVMEIPLEDQKYLAFQKVSDETLRIGYFNDQDELIFVKDKPTIERIQKYLAELPAE